MRVAILPTGRLEWKGFPTAFRTIPCFSEHEFYSLPSDTEVQTQEDIDFPAHSFTSCDVTRIRGKKNNADKLIERAVAEAVGDRRREPADLVLIVDDLELDNLHQPQEVVATMREAVARYLGSLAYNGQAQTRHRDALRSRVSFHIVKPMIESWLFADPSGPDNAGVPTASRTPRLMPGRDPENFQTNDSQYDADTGERCTGWHALPEITSKQKEVKRKHRPQWIKADPRRQLHPKAYMSWLCTDPHEKTCSTYSDTNGGADALAALDWGALLNNPQHACFTRSMMHDIADALGVPAPFPGNLAAETATKSHQTTLLRNL